MRALPGVRLAGVALALLLAGCTTSGFQPNVAQGGRATVVARHPSDDRILLVGAETGGLFRSEDGGTSWRSVETFKSYAVTDVEFAPDDPTIVLATTRADFRTTPKSVWRSTDGGRTWAWAKGSTPPAGPRCGERPSAWSVSFAPTGGAVHVGHDCGLASSPDRGASWTHTALDPTRAVDGDRTQNRVWSVLAQGGGRLNVAAEDGLWFRPNGATPLARATTGPAAAMPGVVHAFAASPFDARHLFHAGRWNQLWLTTDGGATWTIVPVTINGGRPIWVRSALSVSGVANRFDLYLGDGVWLQRRSFDHGPGGPSGGSWANLTIDHADPSDVAFRSDGRTPLLLATDGGLHRTADGGASWTLTGGGAGGYNALQITEVTGQQVGGSEGHQDLYYGTQDNNVVASSDGGVTWGSQVCCEGFFLRTPSREVAADAFVEITGVTCAGCMNFIAGAHLANFRAWTNAPDNDANATDVDGNMFPIRPGGHYIQNTRDNDLTSPPNNFKLTKDSGSSWNSAFLVNEELRGVPIVAGPPGDPTVYHPVRRPGATAAGVSRIGLVRVRNLYGPGPATVEPADRGLGSLGIFPTMFAWYPVLGVDPRNPERLIAPDVESGTMKRSFDGGRSWVEDPELTRRVTEDGLYRFHVVGGDVGFPLVHAVAFDPDNECHILVGTAQNGVIRSTDGGGTWERVSRSKRILNLSSFWFPPSGSVIVSSYGRGLWRLGVGRTASRPCPPPARPVTAFPEPWLIELATGERRSFASPRLEWCPRCDLILARNGAVTALDLVEGRLRGFAVSGGSVEQRDSRGRPVPLAVPNRYRPGPFDAGQDRRLAEAVAGAPVRGLVLEDGRLRALLLGEGELPGIEGPVPYVRVITATMLAGIPTLEREGRIEVHGEGFVPGRPVRVTVLEQAAETRVGSDGRFRLGLQVRGPLGEHPVVVEQQDGRRLTRETTQLKIRPRDDGEVWRKGGVPVPGPPMPPAR
jgi:photosystem II stability/assembly factor-like uncharacterized protein